MSSRPEKKNACSSPPKSRKRPYDNRPRSGPDTAKRRIRVKDDAEIRVVLPAEPPPLTPGAAAALLRILLVAYDQINGDDDPHGGDGE